MQSDNSRPQRMRHLQTNDTLKIWYRLDARRRNAHRRKLKNFHTYTNTPAPNPHTHTTYRTQACTRSTATGVIETLLLRAAAAAASAAAAAAVCAANAAAAVTTKLRPAFTTHSCLAIIASPATARTGIRGRSPCKITRAGSWLPCSSPKTERCRTGPEIAAAASTPPAAPPRSLPSLRRGRRHRSADKGPADTRGTGTATCAQLEDVIGVGSCSTARQRKHAVLCRTKEES
jgi:hypothetical protein